MRARLLIAGIAPAPSGAALRASIQKEFDAASGEVVEPEKELFTVADLSSVCAGPTSTRKTSQESCAREGRVAITVDAYPGLHSSAARSRMSATSSIRRTLWQKVPLSTVMARSAGHVCQGWRFRQTRSTTSVPVDAIQQRYGQSIVFVRQSPTRFERRNV